MFYRHVITFGRLFKLACRRKIDLYGLCLHSSGATLVQHVTLKTPYEPAISTISTKSLKWWAVWILVWIDHFILVTEMPKTVTPSVAIRDGGIGWSASRHHPFITIKQTDINHTLYFTSTIKPSSRSYPSKPFLKLLSTTNRYDKNEYKPYIDTRINIAHLIPRAYTLLEGTWHLTG